MFATYNNKNNSCLVSSIVWYCALWVRMEPPLEVKPPEAPLSDTYSVLKWGWALSIVHTSKHWVLLSHPHPLIVPYGRRQRGGGILHSPGQQNLKAELVHFQTRTSQLELGVGVSMQIPALSSCSMKWAQPGRQVWFGVCGVVFFFFFCSQLFD